MVMSIMRSLMQNFILGPAGHFDCSRVAEGDQPIDIDPVDSLTGGSENQFVLPFNPGQLAPGFLGFTPLMFFCAHTLTPVEWNGANYNGIS